jgi:DNA-binding transcriptional LysR family regulator
MKLRQIEIFCAVMRCRTMSAAAFELGLSQPAISNAIKHMEAQLGLSLFERVGNRLQPTVEAKAIYSDAEPLRAMSEAIGGRIRDLRDTTRGRLRILSTHALGRTVVAKALGSFLKTRNDVHVFFDVRRMEGVTESVESGYADLGIAITPAHRPGMRIEPVISGRMVVALPPRHRLSKREFVTPHDLQKERMVGLEPGSRLGGIVRQSFDNAGAAYRPMVEVRHCVTACWLVQQSLGVSVVDQFSAASSGGWRLDIRPFKPDIKLDACVMYLEGRQLSRLTTRFVQELRKLNGTV